MRAILAGVGIASGIVLIAAVDFLSGVELRTFPLYYAPIALAAWQFGQAGALAAALLSAAGWLTSNQLAGLQYSHPFIWATNVVVQAISFTIVGLLVARLHGALDRERAISRTDPLSGLLNSRALFAEGTRLLELCRRAGRPITLAYIDVDNFKSVNDTRGHAAGDDLLRSIAQGLRASVRASDLAARVGGDEFVVLLPELGADEARQMLDRLHVGLRDGLAAECRGVTLSMGGLTFLTLPDDLGSMVRAADDLMYEAKRAGKNRVYVRVAERAAGSGATHGSDNPRHRTARL